MKQTINLDKWIEKNPYYHQSMFHGWTEEDKKIFRGKNRRVYIGIRYDTIIHDAHDSAFMEALTSKKGMPYIAKLIALQLEE